MASTDIDGTPILIFSVKDVLHIIDYMPTIVNSEIRSKMIRFLNEPQVKTFLNSDKKSEGS